MDASLQDIVGVSDEHGRPVPDPARPALPQPAPSALRTDRVWPQGLRSVEDVRLARPAP